MQIQTTYYDTAVVHSILAERIDASNAETLRKAIGESIRTGHNRLVLDLGRVRFMDSTGVGAIFSTLKTLDGHGDMVLCCVAEELMGLLKLTRMDRVFGIHATTEEGLAAVKG